MKDKKKNKLLLYVFLIFLMIFSTLYIAGKLGYYEYSKTRKKVFTSEQIKKFEDDVKLGKQIDIENYLIIKEDFQGKEQRFGVKVSEFIGKYMKLGIYKIFKILSNFVEN